MVLTMPLFLFGKEGIMSLFTMTKSNNYPAGVNPLPGSDSIIVYDSGNILGTVPPGQAGLKLIDGTQHSATTATYDATSGVTGNFYGVSQSATGFPVQNTTYQGQPKGYSQLGE